MINKEDFYKEFNENPQYEFSAPARINLIGEHIDYNGGKVLPCAISLYTKAFISKRNDDKIFVKSKSFDSTFIKSFDELEYNPSYDWANYPFGAIKILIQKGYKIDSGLNILFDTEIPLGSGLSSSAAILDLNVYSLSQIFNLNLSRKDVALIAQEVENKHCGLSSGIMDEAIISLGKNNKALLLDCNTFDYEYIDIKESNYTYVVMKTNKPRKLTESKYNERVIECNKSLDLLKKSYNIKTLCNLNSKELDNIKKLLNDDVLYRRVKHVICENERVYSFSKALIEGDFKLQGELLNQSDLSLKNDYEVTGLHLDSLTKAARESGAIGARMTGAGFGGCAIALIEKNKFKEFKESVIEKYYKETNIKPDLFLVDIVDGVK